MNINTLILFLVSGLSFFSLAVADKDYPTIYRPTFETHVGTQTVGTAFVIRYEKQNYIVSAQHLLGQLGGFAQNHNGAELQTLFKKVALKPLYDGYQPQQSTELISIPHAASFTDTSFLHDIFIAKVGEIDSKPLTLNFTLPKVGDRIFLYARFDNTKESFHFATVTYSGSDGLGYVFDDKSISMIDASGAPILNQHMNVIGINLAARVNDEGFTEAVANPASTIKAELTRFITSASQ